MNKVFKIVYNAVRDKMMVVNEMTSSMQVGRKKARVAMVVGVALMALGGGTSSAASISLGNPEYFKCVDDYYDGHLTYIYKNPDSSSNKEFSVENLSISDNNWRSLTAGFSRSNELENHKLTINNVEIQLPNGLLAGALYQNDTNPTEEDRAITITNNSVSITNPESNSEGQVKVIYGAAIRKGFKSASVTRNTVLINSQNLKITDLYGGFALYGTVEANKVTVEDGSVTAYISGGYAISGNALQNIVEIKGGSVSATVSGGRSDDGSANWNQVIIQGGTVNSKIIGGQSKNQNGNSEAVAQNNSVSISGDANLTAAELFGGYTYTSGSHVALYGGSTNPNTLNVGDNNTPWTGTVKSIKGFDVINFNGVTWQNGVTLVNTTNLELYNTKITVSVTGGTVTADSESMTLIQSSNVIVGDLATTGNTVTLYSGIANSYAGTIEKDSEGKAITVTVNKKPSSDDTTSSGGNSGSSSIQSQMNEQILVLGESRAAATAFTNQATDLIDSTLDDLGQKSIMGMAGFAAIHGNASEYETGSHVDVNGWSMIVGASSKLENGTTVGAFFETGTGNYRTFNDLDGVTMRGDGESTYWGGGLMARHAFDNGFYAEGSVRVGKLENELKNAVKGSQGLTGYDIDTLYFGAHVGAGKVFELNSTGDNIDVYTKFLYTYNEGKNFAIDGDSVNYSSVTSERLRLGARYTKNVNDKLQAKVGAAWEYDFNGDSKNTVANYDLGTPSLGGSTFMADVGVRYQAAKNVSVDFSGRGYTGQRDGVSGQVNVKFSF